MSYKMDLRAFKIIYNGYRNHHAKIEQFLRAEIDNVSSVYIVPNY